jgi:hypothetical protein
VLVTGLEVPWGVAFLPDGAALVTERRSARLLRVAADGAVTPVGTVAGVVAQGEGGLLGVAVSPDFAADRAVFVAYTSATDNRVVRLQVAPDGTVDGTAQQVVVSGIAKAGIHNGGAVAFGPDGLLYIGTGDAGRRAPAQDQADPGGKILRVTPDGKPAPGNPFGSAVHSLGHRNVQGLAFAPDGTLYAAEFGQNRFDEINRITAGGNYGWPDVEGVGERPGFTDPLVTWSTDEASPSGLAYAGGSLYAAGLRGERLWRVPVTGPGAVGTPEALLAGGSGGCARSCRPRTVRRCGRRRATGTVAATPGRTTTGSWSARSRRTFSRNSAGADLLTQDVGVPAVVRQLAQDLQVHPAQRARPGPVTGDDGVQWQVRDRRPGRLAGRPVGRRDGGDGVVVAEPERLVRGLHQAQRPTGRAADALLEPHPLHPRDVLDQPEQRRRRRDEAAAGLLLGEAVEGRLEGAAVLLDERVELGALVVERHVERAHQSLPPAAGRGRTRARGRRAPRRRRS